MPDEEIVLEKDWFFNGRRGLRKSGIDYPYTQYQINELIRCKKDIIYFLSNYVKILNLDRGIILFEPYEYQKTMIKIMDENRYSIFKIPRQSGKTTTTETYILYRIVFFENEIVGIVANKEKTALKILGEIQKYYAHLPFWMQHGIRTFAKSEFELENGSKIIAEATSKYALSGNALKLVFYDECALSPVNIAEEFLSAISPTISSSTTSKMIISSTPKSYNTFASLWFDAVNGINGYVPFEIKWNDVPGRDEKFKESEIKKHGLIYWNQEFECLFVSSGATLIDGKYLSELRHKIPIQEYYEGKLKIYKLPIDDHIYIMTVDTAEGDSGNFSTFTVFDVSMLPYEPIMSYRNNEIAYEIYPHLLNEIIKKFFKEPENLGVVVENNSLGDVVVQTLNWECECPATIYSENKKLGVKTTKKSKKTGCKTLKDLVEYGKLEIWDYNTINEFFHFGEKSGSFKADEGSTDDLVMNYVIFAYITKTVFFSNFQEGIVFKEIHNTYEKEIKEMIETVPFAGISNSVNSFEDF